MTPKERAQSLVNLFTNSIFESGSCVSKPLVKKCALIAVDEIIPSTWSLGWYQDQNYTYLDERLTTDYWKEVKKEIQAL